MRNGLIKKVDLAPAKPSKANMVFRKLVSMEGHDLGIIGASYDGTLEDAIEVAKKITDQMYAEYPHVSNMESGIRVTDSTGKAKWRISPNFCHVDEIGRTPTPLEKRLIAQGLMTVQRNEE